MHLTKPGKYSIINTSKTNSPLPNFYIIFTWISGMKIWKVFFKKKKTSGRKCNKKMPGLILLIHNSIEIANPNNFQSVTLFKSLYKLFNTTLYNMLSTNLKNTKYFISSISWISQGTYNIRLYFHAFQSYKKLCHKGQKSVCLLCYLTESIKFNSEGQIERKTGENWL